MTKPVNNIQYPPRPGQPLPRGTDGHVAGSDVNFSKVIHKTIRGTFLLKWVNGQDKSVDARNGRLGVPVGLGTVVGLIMHEADYNSAAGVMFLVSNDDATYYELEDGDGNRLEKTFTAGKALYLDPTEMAAWDFIRVVLSDGSGNEVDADDDLYGQLIVMRVNG